MTKYTDDKVFTHKRRAIRRNKRVAIPSLSRGLLMRDTYKREFLSGRIHITAQTKIHQKPSETYFKDRLLKMIKEGVYNQDNKWRNIWVFEYKGEMLYEDEKVFYGYFGKVKEKGMEQTYDMNKHQFLKEYVEKNIAQAYTFFIINPETQVILFEEKNSLKHKQFIKMFEKSYNNFYKTNDQIQIDLIQDETKLLEDLEKKKVLHISFNLKPSNPEDEEDYRLVDNLLKKARANNAKVEIENKIEGLKFDEKEGFARQGVALSGAGYGDYEALVEQDGRQKTIRSKDKVLREDFDISKFSNSEILGILKRFERYRKREKGDKNGK
jgi:hypothetical protein